MDETTGWLQNLRGPEAMRQGGIHSSMKGFEQGEVMADEVVR